MRSDNATSVDVEIDPHCRRLGRSQTDFALQAFGLWRVRFPPVLVRTARRLPVDTRVRGSLGYLDRLLPARRGPRDPESSE